MSNHGNHGSHPGAGHQSPAHAGPGYETTDARVSVIVKLGITTFALMFLGFIAMYVLFFVLQKMPSVSPTASTPPTEMQMKPAPAPLPMLQVDQSLDVKVLRAKEEQILHSYGRDEKSGAVRIPVERAMELLVERGLPAVKPQPPATTAARATPRVAAKK